MAASAVDERMAAQRGLGGTYRLSLTTSSAVTPALPDGRYVLQVQDASTDIAWIRLGKDGALAAVVPGAVSGGFDRVNEFPLDPTNGERVVVIHVRNGMNKVAGIMSSGTATLLLSRTGE